MVYDTIQQITQPVLRQERLWVLVEVSRDSLRRSLSMSVGNRSIISLVCLFTAVLKGREIAGNDTQQHSYPREWKCSNVFAFARPKWKSECDEMFHFDTKLYRPFFWIRKIANTLNMDICSINFDWINREGRNSHLSTRPNRQNQRISSDELDWKLSRFHPTL